MANQCRKGKRSGPRPQHFPKPTKKLKKLVADEFEKIPGVSTGNLDFSQVFYPTNHVTLQDCISAFEEGFKPTKRYVLTFAHSHLYKDSPRHALVVKKAAGTLHQGLFNLPGGKILSKEKPSTAALRELKEECGVDGSFPQLIGAILPSGSDCLSGDFIVYVYRCMLNPGSVLAFQESQPASWELIEEVSNGKYVPSLGVMLPLLATGLMGWVLQDAWWGYYGDNPNLRDNFQSTVTFLRHSVSDAANQKKQRFTT
jgi:ADP-ribose pyrophosphatase YjhB (NUDIX family)